MPHPARLVATLAAPLPFTGADDTPWLTPWPAARLLVQRGETELIVRQVAAPATAEPIRFPAPWPRRCGDAVVSPGATLAVFSGPHGLRAVDRTGAVRWELGHACWAPCPEGGAVTSYAADDHAHRYAPSGSTCFSADGTLVWAHVRGPLAGDAPVQGPGSGEEEWLVLDAADGSVLARAETGTAAAGSFHVPHPDPSRMGLTIGEGQDGSPLRWGRFDGRALTVDRLGDDDLVLLAVGPGGDRLLTVTHDQDTLAVRRLADGAVTAALDASAIPPRAPESRDEEEGEDEQDEEEADPAYFDYAGGFVDEDTAVFGSVESDDEHGDLRHWLVDTARMARVERIGYPFPVEVPPTALGDGTWYTTSRADNALHVWSR
ncbi:hypothetical protein [Streptomyces laurentii]|uniref:hypothetical protein n=1 Tax=Streptomyces laurentii TaxID=39478 RepID=UPI00340C3A29